MTVTSFAQGGVAPQPFRIAVEETTLLDLKRRLDATRWPDEVSDSGWAFGTDLGYLKSVINYWRQDYDWRKYERMLNGFRQFTVPLNDVDVHFIYEQGISCYLQILKEHDELRRLSGRSLQDIGLRPQGCRNDHAAANMVAMLAVGPLMS